MSLTAATNSNLTKLLNSFPHMDLPKTIVLYLKLITGHYNLFNMFVIRIQNDASSPFDNQSHLSDTENNWVLLERTHIRLKVLSPEMLQPSRHVEVHLDSVDRTVYIYRVDCRLLFTGFLLGFDPENGVSTGLRNFRGLLPDYTALHSRR
jgi:hypothetical protein